MGILAIARSPVTAVAPAPSYRHDRLLPESGGKGLGGITSLAPREHRDIIASRSYDGRWVNGQVIDGPERPPCVPSLASVPARTASDPIHEQRQSSTPTMPAITDAGNPLLERDQPMSVLPKTVRYRAKAILRRHASSVERSTLATRTRGPKASHRPSKEGPFSSAADFGF